MLMMAPIIIISYRDDWIRYVETVIGNIVINPMHKILLICYKAHDGSGEMLYVTYSTIDTLTRNFMLNP